MALISQIRKNSWLLIVLIALGMGGFILMDMVSASSKMGGNQFTIGSVNGKKLDWNDFQRAERILYPNSTGDVYGQRNYIWNYLIEEQLVNEEAEALGLSVSEEEMEELQFGQRMSPIVQRNFRDPNTGQINMQGLQQIRDNLNTGNLRADLVEFWNFQTGEVKKDRLQRKLIGIVKKGIYTPTWLATQIQQEQGSSMDVKVVRVPLDTIPDSEVTLTDDDFKKYMAENKGLLKRKEEFRAVDFVVFNVRPTAEDTAALRAKLSEKVAEFASSDDDSLFVENNFGIIDVTYFKKDDLSPVLADTVFDLAVGSVYGPYIDGNEYRVVKVLDKKVIPDSVQSRHILIRANNPTEAAAATAKLDSIKTVIEAGKARFDSLAMRFSQDGSASLGGDLGYSAPGRMVKPFNDVIFYTAKPGDLTIVTTQFGVHLVEVTNTKYIDNDMGVKLAYLVEPIIPSEETQNTLYDKAVEFSGKNRTIEELKKSVAENPELSIETAQGLTANAYQFSTLGSNGTSRDIVRWAFAPETKPGMVAPDVYIYDEPTLFYNARYVIPALKSVVKPGVSSIAEVKENFTPQVMRRKKAEVIAERLKGKDIESIAAQYGVRVDTLNNINFAMNYLPTYGNETKLIGKVTQMQQGQTSEPIAGNDGVFVAQVISKSEASLATDITATRNQLSVQARGSVDSRLLEAVKSNANLKDNRFKFF